MQKGGRSAAPQSNVCEASTALTQYVIRLIDMVLKGDRAVKLHGHAEVTAKLYTEQAERNPATYRFLLTGITTKCSSLTALSDESCRSSDDHLIRLLKAIEVCRDGFITSIFCRILMGFLKQCKPSASLVRQRCVVRLDGTDSLIRCFMPYSSEKTDQSNTVMDMLCSLLVMLFVRDKKFCLKVRLGGLLAVLHNKLLLLLEGHCSSNAGPLSELCCCCVRSLRNARVFGKSEKLMSMLMTAVISDMDVRTVARLMELLYWIVKFRNRQVLSVLESNNALSALLVVLKRHLQQRFIAPSHLEICVFAVASLRNLSRLRRNRDRLVEIGGLETFQSAISVICNDQEYLGSESASVMPSVMTLQESLYALCMSCLPVRPFPISSTTPPPITFPLPISRSPKRFPSRSPEKEGDGTSLCFSPVRQEDITLSSDEDGFEDEDDVLFPVSAPYVDDEEDVDDPPSGLIDAPSELSEATLITNYAQYFKEIAHGTNTDEQDPFTTAATITRKPEGGKPEGNISEAEEFADLVAKAAMKTKSASSFVKIAYPNMIPPTKLHSVLQPLAKIDSKRGILLGEMAHLQEESVFTPRVVYDLDSLLSDGTQSLSFPKTLGNDDRNRIGKMDDSIDHLMFESRFEGGNLRRAIQVSKWRYQLILSPDINELRPHYQWFCFEVSNNEADVNYTFEIINCFKKTSMYNHGMQPVLFSVTEACRGKPEWRRTGSSICYCRNTFCRNDSERHSDSAATRYYFSLRFTVQFEHRADVCYFAYHFPYTYSLLQAVLEKHLSSRREGLYVRCDKLCTSLAGNEVSFLTVTANGTKEQLSTRQIVILSARVHPGECNSSWIMHGIMKYLLTSEKTEAVQLCDQFVFKIIPMLNVDGVVNGSHRCSLAGVDLNRTWDRPSAILHPAVFHTKAVVQYMVKVLGKKPFVFVDLHGHSKRFNVFVFGNNPEESWRISDHSLPATNDFMSLPSLLQQKCDYFSLSSCRFGITKGKESSGRVTLWRQFGITRSYTMESTYCGFDTGPLRGYQVNIGHLLEIGRQLCDVLIHLENYIPPHEQQEGDDLE